MRSHRSIMLEVIVAIALIGAATSSLMLPFYHMLKAEHAASVDVDKIFLADNLFFDAVKDLITMEPYERQGMLLEGLTKYYDKVRADFTVSGFNPSKKRPYYFVAINFTKNNEPIGFYSVIIKNETLLHPD